ncbi:uncharacterized protein [Musca autumnalis]|uniref:uncharacterized protein n=1 Tax=Musca autumnalis TaxID=221902 RepID=UPI003CEC20A7
MCHKQYCAFVLLVLLALASSQGFRSFGNVKHPTLDNHCYWDQHKLTIKVNETLHPTIRYECFKVFCREDYIIDVTYCPRGMPTCGVVDPNQPFPRCCTNCDYTF